MKIIEITEYKDELLSAINGLLPQLSDAAQLLTKPDLQQIVSSPTSHLLLATKNNEFHGCLMLIIEQTVTGKKAWIEDVVVDSKVRGKGIGRLLTESAIALAEKLGANTIDLTSRPTRKAANALYKKAGFKLRATNSYRHTVNSVNN